jgi:hypothetical protein
MEGKIHILGYLAVPLALGAMLPLSIFDLVNAAQVVEVVLLAILVAVTASYVRSTHDIARSTQEQASSSPRIAEENELARQDSLRPLLVLGALRGSTLRERVLNPPPVAHFSSEENRDIVVRWRGDVFNVGRAICSGVSAPRDWK